MPSRSTYKSVRLLNFPSLLKMLLSILYRIELQIKYKSLSASSIYNFTQYTAMSSLSLSGAIPALAIPLHQTPFLWQMPYITYIICLTPVYDRGPETMGYQYKCFNPRSTLDLFLFSSLIPPCYYIINGVLYWGYWGSEQQVVGL